MKLVFVVGMPVPYHTPILNALARQVDLHVIYMSRFHPLGATASYEDEWGVPPEFSYSYHRAARLGFARHDFRAQFSIGISYKLARLRPDVLLISGWGPPALEPILWKRAFRRRAVMWSESTSFSGLFRGRLSNLLRQTILAQVDAYVTNGSLATRYLHELGIKPDVIVTSCLPSAPSGVSEIYARGEAREDGKRFLFVGRLIPRKRPVELVQAFRQLLQSQPDARLTVVGDGPLRKDVEAAAIAADGAIRVLGRLEGERLAPVYAKHDVLVVPSVREVWGLVVNEALAHGLRVVATDQVGSAHDLLNEETGAMVPADDWNALVGALQREAQFRVLPGQRRAAKDRVKACTAAAFAADLHRAAEIALRV